MRRSWFSTYVQLIPTIPALLLVVLLGTVISGAFLVAQNPAEQVNDKLSQSVDGLTNLGVRVIWPVYAVIPRTRDGHMNVTVVMTIWLRRVGGAKGPFDMPHQSQDALRLLAWVDSPRNLHMRAHAHLLLPTEHWEWKPRLRVETEHPGPVLFAANEPGTRQYREMHSQSSRPYSFRVHLPRGVVGNCFKIIEESFLGHKTPVCLPPVASDGVCDSLAPPQVYTPLQPALYMVIGPLRSRNSTRDWSTQMRMFSGRLVNYASYHMAMGVTGLLQYTDELTRQYLMRSGEIVELVRRGYLRLVDWELPERGHADTDGAGAPLSYGYDHALAAGHALLGLSACGTNLVALVADIDEFLYFPQTGRVWPQPWVTCMGPASPDGAARGDPSAVTVYRVQRVDLVTSAVAAKDEHLLWTASGALPNNAADSIGMTSMGRGGGNGSAAGGVGAVAAATPSSHPLSQYDMMDWQLVKELYGKQAQLPAAQVVLYFVHEAAQMYGRSQRVDHRCMVLLHVCNMFRPRRNQGNSSVTLPSRGQTPTRGWRPFMHWLFADPGADPALWEML